MFLYPMILPASLLEQLQCRLLWYCDPLHLHRHRKAEGHWLVARLVTKNGLIRRHSINPLDPIYI